MILELVRFERSSSEAKGQRLGYLLFNSRGSMHLAHSWPAQCITLMEKENT